MDYYRKYLKYKSKYLNELNKIGGAKSDDENSASAVPHSRDLRRQQHYTQEPLKPDAEKKDEPMKLYDVKPLELKDYQILNLVVNFDVLTIKGLGVKNKYVFLLQSNSEKRCELNKLSHGIDRTDIRLGYAQEHSLLHCKKPTVTTFIKDLVSYNQDTSFDIYSVDTHNINIKSKISKEVTNYYYEKIMKINDDFMVLKNHDTDVYINKLDNYLLIYEALFNTRVGKEECQKIIHYLSELFVRSGKSLWQNFAQLVGISGKDISPDVRQKYGKEIDNHCDIITDKIVNEYCKEELQKKIANVKAIYKAIKEPKTKIVGDRHRGPFLMQVTQPDVLEKTYKAALNDLNNFFKKSILYTHMFYKIYKGTAKIYMIYDMDEHSEFNKNNEMLINMFKSFYESENVDSFSVVRVSNYSDNYIDLDYENWKRMLSIF
jgi:hypothetical protein